MPIHPLTEEKKIRQRCDVIIASAAQAMLEEGAPIPMLLDRLLTYAAAQAVQIDGTKNTATVFRTLADNMQSGIFAHLEPKRKGTRH